MKKSLILFTVLWITNAVFGQEKRSSFTFFTGTHYSMDKGIDIEKGFIDCPVGETTYRNVQTRGLALIDAGFLYQYYLPKRKLTLILGANFNQKGYRETGEQMIWDGVAWNSYSKTVKFNYLGAMAGLSYRLVQTNKLKVSLGALLNPEARVFYGYDAMKASYNSLRRYAVSARVFLNMEYQVCSRTSVVVMPFFQSALWSYNYQMLNPNPNLYRPYSTGLSLGLKF
jgi:hypothetical protein